MNITFLIGNGFDLELGLHTKYSDFYEQLNLEEKNNQIYNEISTNIKDWSDFEAALGKYTFKLGEKYRELAENEEKQKLVIEFLDDLEEIKEDLGAYIKKEQMAFESSVAKFDQPVQYLTSVFNDLQPEDKEEFEKRFVSRNETVNRFKAISFNYTSIFDDMISPVKEKSFVWNIFNHDRRWIFNDIVHIHGTLTRFLALGVNDTDQIDHEIFNSEDMYQLIKPLDVIETRESRDIQAEKIIDASDFIIIYGMSLGQTDKKWWQYIYKWLTSSTKNLLIHAYDSKFNSFNSTTKYVRFRERTIKMFLSYNEYEETDEETQEIRKQIFFVPNSQNFFPRKDLIRQKTIEIDATLNKDSQMEKLKHFE